MPPKHEYIDTQCIGQMSLLKRTVSPEQSLLAHSIGDVSLFVQYISTLIACNKRSA